MDERERQERKARALQIVQEADVLAEVIKSYFREASVMKNYAFSILALAVEGIIRYTAEDDGSNYDQLSEDFHEKLKHAHEDIITSDNYAKEHNYGQGDTEADQRDK